MALMTKQRALIGSLIASVAVNLAFVVYLANSGGLRRMLLRLDLVEMGKERAEFQIKDTEKFRLLPNTPAEVVFAGDSLVADGPWSELFSDIHNRGIGGERTFGLLERLDEILESRPKKIFFLIGSNDLSNVVPVAQILRNYRAMLTKVQAESPGTKMYVSALLPINPRDPQAPIYSNKNVQAVNGPLRSLVQEFPSAQFFDLTDLLINDKGELKPEYTTDGLHMNVKGYLAIKPVIGAMLDQP